MFCSTYYASLGSTGDVVVRNCGAVVAFRSHIAVEKPGGLESGG